MATKQTIATVVAALCEAFNRQPTTATFRAYEIGLEGIEDFALNAAAVAVLQSGTQRFMPTPGELRALALTGGRGVEAIVDEVWATLCKAVGQFGGGQSINFRDALVNATVTALGGWERCCYLPPEEFEKWFQKDFRATYRRFMQSGAPENTAGYLVGENERINMKFEGVPILYEHDGTHLVRRKRYERPTPIDVEAPYQPLLESQPAAVQIERQQPKLEHREIA